MDIKQKSAPQRELWAQFDALQLGSGWEEEDIRKPQILLEEPLATAIREACIWRGLVEQAKVTVLFGNRPGFPDPCTTRNG